MLILMQPSHQQQRIFIVIFFKNVDMDSSKLMEPFTGEKPTQIMVDSLETHRFTFDSATENMFPPTRLKMAMGALFMLPGIPVVQYGTEIAMNGKQNQIHISCITLKLMKN